MPEKKEENICQNTHKLFFAYNFQSGWENEATLLDRRKKIEERNKNGGKIPGKKFWIEVWENLALNNNKNINI